MTSPGYSRGRLRLHWLPLVAASPLLILLLVAAGPDPAPGPSSGPRDTAVDGWVLDRVETHSGAEFLRYWFVRGDERTGVEVNVGPDAIQAQAAPGETPPRVLVDWARDRASQTDATHQLTEPRHQDVPSQPLLDALPIPPLLGWLVLAAAWVGLIAFLERRRPTDWQTIAAQSAVALAIIGAATLTTWPDATVLVAPLSWRAPYALVAVVTLWMATTWVERHRPRSLGVSWKLLLPLVAGLAAALALTQPETGVTEDVARDLLIGADCLADGPCGSGAMSSFGRLLQGTMWPRATAWSVLTLNAPTWALSLTVGLLHATGLGVVVVASRQLGGRHLSALAAAAQLVAVTLVLSVFEFNNHTAVPFSAPFVVWFVLRLARTGRLADAIGLAAALVLLIESHTSGWWTLAPAALTVLALARRPALSALVFCATVVLLGASISPESFPHNLRQIAVEQVGPTGIRLALIGSVLLGFGARRLLPVERPTRRLAASLGLWCGSFIAMCAVVVSTGHPFHAVYLLTVAPFAAVLVPLAGGAVAHTLGRRPKDVSRTRLTTAVVVLCVSGLLCGLYRTREAGGASDRITVSDCRRLAAHVLPSGEFGQLAARIRGPDNRDWITALAPFSMGAPAADGPEIAILRLPAELWAESAGPGWRWIPTGDASGVAVRPHRSIIDLSTVQLCVGQDDTETVCAEVDFDHYSHPGQPGFRWADRAIPRYDVPYSPTRAPGFVRYRMPLRSDVPGPVTLVFNGRGAACPWRLTTSPGVAASGSDAGLTISRVAGPHPWVEAERDVLIGDCPQQVRFLAPGFIEAQEGDSLARAAQSR